MKKRILTLAAASLMMTAFVTSCKSPEQKVNNAEKEVIKANENLDEANDAYLADVEKYRIEASEKITANQKSIADFNARIESQKKEAKEDYKKKVAALEQKNSDMKKKLDDYNAESKDQWETFKSDFNKDLNNLGESINNFFK